MKTVIVMRHGKSGRRAPQGGDHERPLTGRGRRAAELMGRYLSCLGGVPDIVVSSSAVRARDTARIASEAGGWPGRVIIRKEIYRADPEALIALVRGMGESHAGFVLVGHEPTCSGFIGKMVGGAPPRFPTAAMARIDVACSSWRELRHGDGRLIWLVPPKALLAFGRHRDLTRR